MAGMRVAVLVVAAAALVVAAVLGMRAAVLVVAAAVLVVAAAAGCHRSCQVSPARRAADAHRRTCM